MKFFSKTAAFAAMSVLALSAFAADAAKAPAAKKAASPTIPQKDLVVPKPANQNKKPATFESTLSFLPDVVAEIGPRKITKQDFIKELKESGATPEMLASRPEAQLKPMIANTIKQYVDQEVISTLALKDGFKADEKNAGEFFDLLLKKTPKAQLAQVEAQLKMMGKDLKSYRAEIIKQKGYQKQAAIMMWIEKKFRSSVKVTEAEIKDFYNKNREVFNVPESVNASHILIKFDEAEKDAAKKDKAAKAKAEKILAQLKQGADFGKLAEKESACPSGKSAKGCLGPFTKGQMVPEFEKVAFSLKPGTMSGLVKTSFGYHIIKVNSKTPASVRQLKDVRPEIENYLKEKKCADALKQALENAKKAMNVKINAFIK